MQPLLDEDGYETQCPICHDNEDDPLWTGHGLGCGTACGQTFRWAGMCTACGHTFYGKCACQQLATVELDCPTCRAVTSGISDEEIFKRVWKLNT